MPVRHTFIATSIALAFAVMADASAETIAQVMPESMDMLRHAIATQTEEGKDKVPELARYLVDKRESGRFREIGHRDHPGQPHRRIGRALPR